MHPYMQRQFFFFWLGVHKRKSSPRRMTNHSQDSGTADIHHKKDHGIIRVGGNLISVLINRSLSGAA
jgi:hypothetical protein